VNPLQVSNNISKTISKHENASETPRQEETFAHCVVQQSRNRRLLSSDAITCKTHWGGESEIVSSNHFFWVNFRKLVKLFFKKNKNAVQYALFLKKKSLKNDKNAMFLHMT
jgi:hypothetical protein